MITREDLTELLFRILFCVIFIGLSAEHLFKDDLIRLLMPDWVPWPRVVSIICGLWLVFWGSLILLGWHLKSSAIALGAFVVIVTALVHAPALLAHPSELPETCVWMWISFSAATSSKICACSESAFICCTMNRAA
jgi:uncharacterized membrane protein